jgi:hypothetical protein
VIASGYQTIGTGSTLTSGNNDFFASAFTPSVSGVCVVTGQVSIENQGASASNLAGIQTIVRVNGGSTSSDVGWTNNVMADGDSEGSASKTAIFQVTGGSSYELGTRVLVGSDSVGDLAFPTVTYFCM